MGIRRIKRACGAAVTAAAALLLGGIVCILINKNADTAPPAKETEAEEYRTDMTVPGLSGTVAENEAGESVFSISLNDFIEQYNSVYRQRHGIDYLIPENSDNWYRYSELSPRFGYESFRHQFTADKTIWPMPTISLYTENQEEIFEIRMTFDDHGYQERFRALFKELCICMEKTALPELSEEEADTLFETLYARSYENFFGNHSAYGDPERPPLDGVYQCGNIGIYSFYGAGNIEICFIPLTENAVNAHAQKSAPR